jgi:hypothetical protein
VAKPVTAENSGHSNNQLIFNLFYQRWTRPTVFRLRTPPPNVISQAGLTLTSFLILQRMNSFNKEEKVNFVKWYYSALSFRDMHSIRSDQFQV